MKHAFAFAFILAALPAGAEPHNPTVYGLTEEFHSVVVMTEWDDPADKLDKVAEFVMDDGGIICGPLKFFATIKGKRDVIYELKPGHCTGGFYPNIVMDNKPLEPSQ